MVEKVVVPRRASDWFRPGSKEWTLRAIKFFEGLTKQSNDTVTKVINGESELTSLGSRVSRNAAKIHSIELRKVELLNTSVGITTGPFQVIICENETSIDIVLDTNAVNEDEVSIIRTDASVNIIGSVNKKSGLKINVKGSGPKLIFDESNLTWWRI